MYLLSSILECTEIETNPDTAKIKLFGSLTLKPYNPEYSPKTYRPEDVGVSILGVVVQMRRTLCKKNKAITSSICEIMAFSFR